MLLKVYTIRDSKAEVYNTPFFQKTHGEAERSFNQLLRDEKSMVNKYPEDYDLYFIGNWDDQEGTFTPCDTPQHIAKAAHLVAKNTQQELNTRPS